MGGFNIVTHTPGTESLFVTVLPTGGLLLPVSTSTLEVPEERLRKFKYPGKDVSVSMRQLSRPIKDERSEKHMVKAPQK